MASGQPLTDADRAGWLARVAETLRINEENVVIDNWYKLPYKLYITKSRYDTLRLIRHTLLKC